jgi:hypothetical protein
MNKLLGRRSFLQWSGIASTMFWFGNVAKAAEELMPAVNAVDHLLLAIDDLDRGIDWVEKNLGIKASVGGSHPGVGTRNALLSLGDKHYLEIISIDPEQKTYGFPVDVRTIQEPQLVMWAASTSDIQRVVQNATDAGIKMMGPFEGSRNRPDGKTLKWKSAFAQLEFRVNNIDPIPFFIQWDVDSIHPSTDSAKGCHLKAFEMEHPKANEVQKTLRALGLDVKVTQSQNTKLIATLDTPKGELKLS